MVLIIDHFDRAVGARIFLFPAWNPSAAIGAVLFALTPLIHTALAFIMHLLGLKARTG